MSHSRMTAVVLGLFLAAAPLAAQAPAGATGKCGDGTGTSAKTKSGACSNHGGVKEWYGPAATPPAAPPKASPSPRSTPAAKMAPPAMAPANATGRCTDGTTTAAKTKSGACSNHGGVKEWFGVATAAPAPMPAPPRATPSPRAAPPAAAPATVPTRAIPGSPAGASALCNDGTYSHSQHRSGSCSSHGGVKQWLKELPPS
ncbi:MAG: DUF3761 domain-containing protein [Gemmatimonadales bacterium]